MFTGIIEEIGTINFVQYRGNSAILSVKAKEIMSDISIGDSISVNGICLTVTAVTESGFTADVMHETLRRSSLRQAYKGCHVNLERAMAAKGRFGGHIVTGHIDGTGIVVSSARDGNAIWFTLRTNPEISRYIIEKGSIAIDGISLTVAGINGEIFHVSVIPHTYQNTVLCERRVGDLVNLENDCIGKYVEKQLETIKISPSIEAILEGGM